MHEARNVTHLSTMFAFFLLVSTGICCPLVGEARVVDRDLPLQQPRFGEQVDLRDIIRYTLHGLQPSAAYEVRVSYPATVRFFA